MPRMGPDGPGAKPSLEPSLRAPTSSSEPATAEATDFASASSSPSVWLRLFTAQDSILLIYLVIVSLLVWGSPASPLRSTCARGLFMAMSAVVFGCFIGRLAPEVPSAVRNVVYRVAVVGTLLYNYLSLRDLLPLIRPDSLDAQLMRIDEAIFGVEPALWLERFNTRPIVEWFSFFYFSYFFICTLYAVITLAFARVNRHSTTFAIGTAMVYSIGQLGYMAVPGYGPIRFLEAQFKGPINGGFFWSCVWETVQAGSAMKDIFPSLHTAAPVWFALYALHRAKDEPRWLWPGRITAFFACNIIISTVFLRWHYVIDVFAGLALAFSVRYAAPRIARWEEQMRARSGTPGVWSFR